MAICKINTALLPVKALTFFFYAGWAGYNPYRSLFQKKLGLSPTQNGLIQAVDRIVGIVGQPVSGVIADKSISIKFVMIIWLILGAAFVFPMIFIPPLQSKNSTVQLQCCNGKTQVDCFDDAKPDTYCNVSTKLCRINGTQDMECKLESNPKINKTTSLSRFLCLTTTSQTKTFIKKMSLNASCNPIDIDAGSYGITFALTFFLTMASSIFLSPLPALIDATTLQVLGKDQVDLYGYQRLWGAIGYGIVGLVVGLVMDVLRNDETGSGPLKDFLFAFISSSVLFVITAIICVKLDIVSPEAQNIFVGVISLFKKMKIILFFLMVYFSGCALGLQYSFFFWFVDTLPGSSRTILGFSIVVNVVAEIPVFIVSEKLAKRTSYSFLLSLSLFFFGIRFSSYTLVSKAWQVVPLESLHGLSFALTLAALNAEAAFLSPEGMVATTVGVTQAIYRGMGFTTGALLGGVVYTNYGPITTFRGMAIICFVVSILYFTAMKIETYFNQTNDSNACDESRHLMQSMHRGGNTPAEKSTYCSKDETLSDQ